MGDFGYFKETELLKCLDFFWNNVGFLKLHYGLFCDANILGINKQGLWVNRDMFCVRLTRVQLCCWFVVHLTELDSSRKRGFWLRSYFPVRLACKSGGSFLIRDWYGRVQFTESGFSPGWTVLDYTKKESWASNASSWPLLQFLLPDSYLDFLPWLLYMKDYKLWEETIPFLPSCFWLWCLFIATQSMLIQRHSLGSVPLENPN